MENVSRKISLSYSSSSKNIKVFYLTYSIDYQGLEGLDGVESLITNVGGRLLMLQRDKNYPERKTKKVSRNSKASKFP